MQFPKQLMSESELKKSQLYKDLERHLKAIPIIEINDNDQRNYRTPSTGRQANIYDIIFEFGRVMFFVEKGGNVSRVVIDTPQEGDRVIETLGKTDKVLETTVQSLAKEIIRTIRKEQKSELKVKVNKKQMEELIRGLDEFPETEGAVESLTQLKLDLTKGSGKLIVVNEKNEVLGIDAMNGYVTNKLLYKVFNSVEDAKKAKQTNDKIVRI